MSYLVLARKYRPTTFADIVGQEHVVRTLANAIRLGRVHHAFLLTGARGVGKTTTARVLARALNCERGPTPEPCGTCTACTEIAGSASPDVLEIDGASNTGVDNVRELREAARYLPSRGRFKLYIIDEVHMLSTAAFNALLKTLEEPPPHVKFIFATTEPQKIPVTILSRCQRFDFRRVSVQQLTGHLKGILEKEGVTLAQGALAAIVREAQGSVRDALSLLDQVLSFAGDHSDEAAVAQALGIVEREVVFQLAEALLGREATRLLQLVAEVDARGHDLADVAALLVEHFRDLMVVKVATDAAAILLERSPGELATLATQAQAPSRPDLHRLFSGLVAVAEDVSRSAFQRVSFEMGLLRLLEIEPAASLSDLLARLDALARGAGTTSGPDGGGSSGGQGERAAAATPAAQVLPASGSAPKKPSPPRGRGARSGTAGALDASGASDAMVAAAAAGEALPAGSEAGVVNLAWSRLVDRVRQVKPALASVLEHARLLRFGPDGVELGFAPNTFYWEAARDPEVRSMLARLLTEQFGQPVGLTITPLDGAGAAAPASLAELRAEEKRRREQEIKDSALAHPAVRDAIAILGGRVTDVLSLAGKEDAAAGGRR